MFLNLRFAHLPQPVPCIGGTTYLIETIFFPDVDTHVHDICDNFHHIECVVCFRQSNK